MDRYQLFHELHYQQSPLLLGNAWDVVSAKVYEQRGFKAIATSSAAVARTFGYEDGEQIPFDLLVKMVERIGSNVNVPLSVDMEGGYSRITSDIIKNIERVYDAGAVGINLEDSLKGDKPYLLPEDDFRRILIEIKESLEKKNMRMFINARTDAYLVKLPDPLNETLKRIKTYEDAGASGIFVPFLFDKGEIIKVVQATKLPVNVFAMAQLPAFSELSTLGIKRISMAAAVHRASIRSLENILQRLLDDGSCKSLF